MKLEHEFYKLPLTFDVNKLAEEVLSLNEEQWIPHPDGFVGNFSIPLISLNGEQNNAFNGPMKVTPVLSQLEYISQILSSFGEVFGRSRLMRLSPGTEVPLHTDTNYHWYKRVRIHIPIITDEKVIFHCDEKNVHMAAGETWIFDTWKHHKVINNGKTNRIHLVIDTSGSSKFWNMVSKSAIPCEGIPAKIAAIHLPFQQGKSVKILTESYNSPVVMSAGEMEGIISDIINEMHAMPSNNKNDVKNIELVLKRLTQDWRQIWSLYADTEAGWQHYSKLRNYMGNISQQFNENIVATNGVSIAKVLQYCVLIPALNNIKIVN